MPDATGSRRHSFILRLTRAPAEGAAMSGWCGTLELTPPEAGVPPLTGGFNDLAELPGLIAALVSERDRRANP